MAIIVSIRFLILCKVIFNCAAWPGLNKKSMTFILDMDADRVCAGPVIVIDENDNEVGEELETIMDTQRPITLLQNINGAIATDDTQHKSLNEVFCRDVILFVRKLSHVSSLHREIDSTMYVRHFVIVMRNASINHVDNILSAIKNENIWLLNQRGQDTVIHRWIVSDQVQRNPFSENKDRPGWLTKADYGVLNGRHLTITTLDFPPIVFVQEDQLTGEILATGIEPSITDILAQRLDFKITYVLPVNNEMWGTLNFDGGNVTVTGMLGLLHNKKADVAYGDLHIQQRLLDYVDFTTAFRNNYECFLIPAPKPYAKWTALYHPFSPTIWAVTGVAFVCAVITLRILAKCASSWHRHKDAFFSDSMVCFLYILGNMLGIQQTQLPRSLPNQFFLTWWLLTAATIIPTVYRSGLISYITFPYSPLPIDTLQGLIESEIRPISWGMYYKTSLLNSTHALEHKLGEKMIVGTNVTNMFSTLETEAWAIMSNQGNLRYEAAARFPTSSNGPRVHLMKECVFPTRSAMGLQKKSSLKPYLDNEINRLAEAGIIDHITSTFAKKLDDWDPQAHAGKQVSYSLDSLQGAFYLWAFGIALSFWIFVSECITYHHFKRT